VEKLMEPLDPNGEEPVESKADPDSPETATSLVERSRFPEPVERPTPVERVMPPPLPADDEPADK